MDDEATLLDRAKMALDVMGETEFQELLDKIRRTDINAATLPEYAVETQGILSSLDRQFNDKLDELVRLDVESEMELVKFERQDPSGVYAILFSKFRQERDIRTLLIRNAIKRRMAAQGALATYFHIVGKYSKDLKWVDKQKMEIANSLSNADATLQAIAKVSGIDLEAVRKAAGETRLKLEREEAAVRVEMTGDTRKMDIMRVVTAVKQLFTKNNEWPNTKQIMAEFNKDWRMRKFIKYAVKEGYLKFKKGKGNTILYEIPS
jgi:hypothetical protein